MSAYLRTRLALSLAGFPVRPLPEWQLHLAHAWGLACVQDGGL